MESYLTRAIPSSQGTRANLDRQMSWTVSERARTNFRLASPNMTRGTPDLSSCRLFLPYPASNAQHQVAITPESGSWGRRPGDINQPGSPGDESTGGRMDGWKTMMMGAAGSEGWAGRHEWRWG